MKNILIIDDDKNLCNMLHRKIGYLGYHAQMAHTLADGSRCAAEFAFDVVILDVRLPDGNGLAALPGFKLFPDYPEIIIITGESSPDGAELAIKYGAWDYIEKPLSMTNVKLQLARVFQYRQEKKVLKTAVALKRDNLIGTSIQLKACLELVAQSANSNANVLITGATGTGKELFAKAIHENSARCEKHFVVVDCASLPKNLTESLLFGHEKGAFTGADRYQEGLIKLADGGTLFLDEVGELPLSVQKRFLRVLQERRFRPVGSSKEIKSNFRLISATNRNLDDMVQEGQFRQDLLFRLRTFSMNLPLLKDRIGDIKELAIHYFFKICDSQGQDSKGFVPEMLDILENYNWPGNVRELVNTLEKTILAAADSPVLYPKHLPEALRIKHIQLSNKKKVSLSLDEIHGATPASLLLPSFERLPTLKTYREHLIEQGECDYIKRLMMDSQNDINLACKISGLGKSRLYGLINKYNIPRDKK